MTNKTKESILKKIEELNDSFEKDEYSAECYIFEMRRLCAQKRKIMREGAQ